MGSIIFSFRNFRKAFTLIELMIVISIIGVLTVALIPQMSQYMNRSRDAERLSNMSNIQLALEQYKVENKIYPTHSGGCAPTNTLITGNYLTKPSSSPSGVTYNEGCGNNGEFGYGRKGGNGYILMSIMENPQGGNYSGSTDGFTGEVSASGIAKTANIVKGAGKVYLRATSSIIASAATVTIDPPEAGVCGITANTCNLGTSTGYSAGACGGFQTWYCDGLNGGATSPQCQYTNALCLNCDLSGTTVVHGGSTPAYLAPNVTSPATCGAPITRNCTNGTLDGSATYAYPTCVQSNRVTFNGNTADSGLMSDQIIASGGVATLASNTFSKTGYSFAGWATGAALPVVYANSASYTMGSSNTTLYAKWTALGYTVSGTFTNGSGATVTGCSGKNATADASGNFSFGLVSNATNCTDIIATRATYTCSTALPGPASLSSNFTTVAGTCISLPAFTTTWKVGTAGYGNADNTIAFNVTFSGTNYSIDWGDGTIQTLTTTTPSHTYATTGDKTVKIIGGLQRFYNASWNSNYFGKLTAVTDWGNMSWTSMQQMFFYANHFNNIPVTAPDLTNVTSMQQMFWVASVFNQSINAWNTSSVTNMNAMFWLAEGFNNGEASGSSTTPLNWNTSSVTNMGEMFGGATALNQPLNSWNVSNVTDMNNMFYNASAFNQPLNSWNTSSVTNMHMMFGQAYEFNQPLNSWNVSNVTDMGAMFRVATKFNQDISSWNTTKVGNMTSMFSDASAFNQNIHTWCVPLIATKSSSFDTNSNVGFLNQAAKQPQWGGCSYTVTFNGNGGTGHTPTTKLVASGAALGTLPSNPAQAGYSFTGWYTAMTGGTTVTAATVISTGATFYAQWISLPAFTTTWKVGTAGYGNGNKTVSFNIVFTGSDYTVDWGDGTTQTLSGLTTSHTYATAGDKIVKIYGGIQRFYNPSMNKTYFGKLIAVTDWGNMSWTSMDYMFAFADKLNSLPVTGPNMAMVTGMLGTFQGALIFDQPLNSWNVSNVTNMSGMFSGALAFNQPLNSWNVSSVVDMSWMFQDAELFNQNISTWNVGSVTNMGNMFRNAMAFNQPLNSWNVSNVVDMNRMFRNAIVFNQPIGSWNTSNVTNMSYMFSYASLFNQNISTWNTSKVTTLDNTFMSASAFNQPLNSWNVGSVTSMSGTFNSAYDFNQPLNLWDVSKVVNMQGMFISALAFNQNINSWNVGNVIDMNSMFYNTWVFNQPLNSWNVSKVIDMGSMFILAKVFNQPLNSWNVSSAVYLNGMFGSAYMFNQNINSWNVSNVIDMSNMFNTATAFNQPLNNWNTSNVEIIHQMFAGTSGWSPMPTVFNQDISSWNVSKVWSMAWMFYYNPQFNRNIHTWCVPLVPSIPYNFDAGGNAGFVGNTAIQPQWGGCSYTVTFNGNGGSGHTPTTQVVTSGAALGVLPTNPTRSGYTFNGWYTAMTGGITVTAATVISTGATFYAQWSAATCNTADITLPNGQVWEACNVGSSIAGTTSASYGNYYQWGRNDTGFTVGWNTNNWGPSYQGPCKTGYHIPSKAEWASAFQSAGGVVTYAPQPAGNGTPFTTLKMPTAGNKDTAGNMNAVGMIGFYWTSDSGYGAGIDPGNLIGFGWLWNITDPMNTSVGASVRCMKDANGACGSANGVSTTVYPTANWCTTGTKVDVDTVGSDGAYDWSCNGSGGGSSVNCSANGMPYSYKNGDSNYGGTVYISGAPPTYVLKAILPNQAGLTAADLGKACTMVDRVWGNGTKTGTIGKVLQYECSSGGAAIYSPTYKCITPGPTGPGNYTCPAGSIGKWASRENASGNGYGSCQVVTDASKATGLGC